QPGGDEKPAALRLRQASIAAPAPTPLDLTRVFNGDHMRQVRRRAAQALRAGNEWSSEVNEVLDFFETVGLRGCMACRSWSVSQYLSPGRLRRARSRPHPPRLLLRPLLRGVELDQVVALHGEAMARGRAPCWRLCGPGDNAVYSRRWNATFVADSESTPARASKRPGGRACSTRRNAS